MKKVCIITGTRAEYGLLAPLMAEVRDDPALELQVVATAAHLAPEFGLTYLEIEADGFPINRKVEMLLASDSPFAVAKSMGLGMIALSDVLRDLAPDVVVLLGDRFETLAAAAACAVCLVPVAHIHGGELSLGAVDDAFRHAITKMSLLHFVSTKTYRRRVIQMGEDPSRVFWVGAMGVENALNLELLGPSELAGVLGFDPAQPYVMVTFHPATLEEDTAESQCNELLAALSAFPKLRAVFTFANADAGGRAVNRMIREYCESRPGMAQAHASLGRLNYLSAVRLSRAVLGNSSSGILEAPALETPTVNIGGRQAGRVRAKSVLDCEPERDSIRTALEKALSPEFREGLAGMENPYHRPGTARAIRDAIRDFDFSGTRKKGFYDLPGEDLP
ncbi:MAG: UDP-N-acetylglucosamine 2-epimerase (hydrolyzing) [Proteobacteria bacterium]|nr:UDP-N-acetylglucosamine 2-epimerase (hydrolyzing) [Pseudomonadota bacterium]